MREQSVRCNDRMSGKSDTVGKNNSDLFFLRAGKFERGWGDERWERGNADEEEGRSERANNRAGRTVCGLSFSFSFSFFALHPLLSPINRPAGNSAHTLLSCNPFLNRVMLKT
jgi:hypothetical protein